MFTIEPAEDLRQLRMRLNRVQRAMTNGRPADAAALVAEASRLQDEIAQLLRWNPNLT